MGLLTRAQELLKLKMGELSPAMQQDFKNGLLNFSDSVYYIRYEITGAAGLWDLLHNDDSVKDGFCSFSKQKIRQGCALMIDRISARAGYVATGGTQTPAQINYLPIENIGTVDPIIAASELEVDVAQLNIFQAPINSFNQAAVAINGAKDSIILTAPKLITDSQEVQLRMHIPQGLSVDGTTNRYFIEIGLHGAEIRVK